MIEPKKGDLLVANELMGFVIDYNPSMNTVKLNTLLGEGCVNITDNCAVIASAAEVAQSYSNHLRKVVQKS